MSAYLTFAITCLALLLSSINNSALTVAFPVLVSDFHTSLISAGWVLSMSQLASTAGMPLSGKASDIFGRKFIFLVCAGLFTAGSLLSAIAPNIELLIFFRLIQGLGIGGFMPSATGLIADAFPRKIPQMIGLSTGIFVIGQLVGPILGGWMTESFGWRSVFWFSVPVGIIIIITSILFLKSSAGYKSRMDLLGAGLFTGSITALMIGLSLLGSGESLPVLLIALFFMVCLILMIFFIRHENLVKEPIIDLQILREKPFMAANIFNFIIGMTIIGVFSFVPFYAINIYSLSTIESGLIMAPNSIGAIGTTLIISIFIFRFGYRNPMLIGTIITIVSVLILGIEVTGLNLLGIQISGIVIFIAALFLAGLAAGLIVPAANAACIELMPRRVSTISGVRGMFRQTGGAIGITISTLILHNVGNAAIGFNIIFFSICGILILSIPLIYAMPHSPDSTPCSIEEQS